MSSRVSTPGSLFSTLEPECGRLTASASENEVGTPVWSARYAWIRPWPVFCHTGPSSAAKTYTRSLFVRTRLCVFASTKPPPRSIFLKAFGSGVGVGGALLTVTPTSAAEPVLPAVSRTTAERECAPAVAVVVSHATVYGAAVSSAPRFAPSSLNCTPATPVPASAALADTSTEPVTVDPAAGAVRDAVGAVASIVQAAVAARPVLPAASVARTAKVCAPSATAVYAFGLVQAAKAAPSREQAKVAPASDEKEKLGAALRDGSAGFWTIVAAGA